MFDLVDVHFTTPTFSLVSRTPPHTVAEKEKWDYNQHGLIHACEWDRLKVESHFNDS